MTQCKAICFAKKGLFNKQDQKKKLEERIKQGKIKVRIHNSGNLK